MEFGEEKGPEKISFDDGLRKYVLASPFVSFDIITTSGHKYEIADNVQVAIGASSIGVMLPKTGFQLIRKNQVTAIHVHEPV